VDLGKLDLDFMPLAPTKQAQKYHDAVASTQVLPYLAPRIHWLAEELSEELPKPFVTVTDPSPRQRFRRSPLDLWV
jgi:hypothetical protein